VSQSAHDRHKEFENMIRIALLWVALLFVTAAARAEPVTLTAADGVKVYGDHWPAAARGAPLILAFHQAGSSRAEYLPLAPRLNSAGFSVLTIDQRSGGGEFGGKNRTVATLGRSAPYDAALADLEAALAWGRTQANGAPVLVLGSSHSAALVFLLAAKHPAEVQGLLAFSPGEYLAKPSAVGQAARKLRLPVFIDQASDDEELAASRAIFDALPGSDNKTLFAPTRGVHGAATLRRDRNAAGAEENWDAVLAFLARFKPAR
jgi:dienelactone hydrolase